MRLMITGGGTGGHVFPGIAVAREVLQAPGAEVLYVGKRTGPEEGWLKEQKIPFEGLRASGWPRGLSIRWITFWIDLASGFLRAWGLIGSFRPQAVLSTGGYVSFPLSMAALLRRVPVFLLEPNVVPGLAARVISLFAERVFAGFPGTVDRLPKRKSIHSGIPVRQEILEADASRARQAFDLLPEIPTVLFFGGSQGASHLNQVAAESLRVIGDGTQPLQAILMTGRNDYQSVADTLEKCPLKVAMRQFITNIHEAYAAADLVVCRAGAMTCAELTARGIPSILIPYPFAGAHQEKNARALEAVGAAVVLMENDLDAETLTETLLSILQDPGRLAAMGVAARKAGRPDAGIRIVREMVRSLEEKGGP